MLLLLRTWLIIKGKQFIVSCCLFLGKGKPVNFVILCQPRTGSTLLHTYLNSHSAIVSYGEQIRNGKHETTVFQLYPRFIKAVGFKLFYNDIESEVFKKVVANKDIKIIHLVRYDLLRQFVLLKIAEKTGEWSEHKASGGLNKTTITVNPTQFEKFRMESTGQRQQMIETFAQHQHFQVVYEDLCNSPDEILNQLQAFLKVKPKRLFSLLKKQNSEQLNELVSNYSEIENTLSN